jgi:hypothetical protein
MIDTAQVTTEIRQLITTGTTARELLVKVARKLPTLTSAEPGRCRHGPPLTQLRHGLCAAMVCRC